MKNNMKLFTIILSIACLMSFSTFVFADNTGNGNNSSTSKVNAAGMTSTTAGAAAVIIKPLRMNIEEAVKTGLQNSVSLRLLENATALSALQDERAIYNKSELDNNSFFQARDQINSAQSALNSGVAPQDIDASALGLGTIPKGQNIQD